jgi:hypothetical protein
VILQEEKVMRKFDLHKLFLAVVMVLGLAIMGSSTADAKDLNLVNNTGKTIVVFNCSPTISTQWYEDLLGNGVWENGTTFTLDFDRLALSENWDFKVHYRDGSSEDWYNVNVNNVNTIILRPNGVNEYL